MKKIIGLLTGLVVLAPISANALELGFGRIETRRDNGRINPDRFNVVFKHFEDNLVEFTFNNMGNSSITHIYFEDTANQYFTGNFGLRDRDDEYGTGFGDIGVDFSRRATPRNLPFGGRVDFQSSRYFSFDSDAPEVWHGIDGGEELRILLEMQTGVTLDDVMMALICGIVEPDNPLSMRIGVHAQRFNTDRPNPHIFNSFVTDEVLADYIMPPRPEPDPKRVPEGKMLLGLTVFAGILLMQKRKDHDKC